MGMTNDFKRAVKEVVYGNQVDDAQKIEKKQAAENQKVEKKQVEEPKVPMVEKKETPPVAVEAPAKPVGTTVIAAGTVIHGTLETSDMVEMNGEMIGDICCKAGVSIAGKIQGNINAELIKVNDAVVKGNMVCKSTLNLSRGTQVVGDLKADAIFVEGRIKGNIVATGIVTVGESAMIIGDITAGELELKRGAYIDGKITLTNLKMDENKYFDQFSVVKA